MIDLYRFFNSDQKLIYVGISYSTFLRFVGHRSQSKWINEVTTITIEKFSNLNDALIAEANAIKNEKPIYNVALNSKAGKLARKVNSDKPFMNVTDISRLLRVDRNTVYAMTYDGRLPKRMDDKKPYRWHSTTIHSWMNGVK